MTNSDVIVVKVQSKTSRDQFLAAAKGVNNPTKTTLAGFVGRAIPIVVKWLPGYSNK
jgi:hypothetical protein